MNPKRIGWGGLGQINVNHGNNKWRAVVQMVIEPFGFHKMRGIFMTT